MTGQFSLTIFRDVRATEKHEITLDLAELAERIHQKAAPTKEDLPLGSFAKFGDKRSDKGSLRHDGNAEAFWGIWVEHDAGVMSFEEAHRRIAEAGVAAVLYTTPSHRPEAPRWRAGFPFSGVMPQAAGYRNMVDRANALLGGVLARESWAVSQSYYLGHIEDAEHFKVGTIDGDPIDTRQTLAANGYAGGDAGPAFLRRWTDRNGYDPDETSRDDSRSGEAMRIGHRMAREGKSYEEFCAAVRVDRATSGWYHEKGKARGERELKRIWTKVNRDSEDPSRPMVRIKEGELPRVVDEAEAALIVTDRNVYRFGSKLVTVAWGEIRVSAGGKERALRVSSLGVPALLERFDLAARFAKWNATAGGYVPCHCPKEVAERYLSRDGNWRAPALLGVVTAPCLRSDGTVLDEPGYDPQTALLFDPLGVDFPTIPDRPGRKDAEEALGQLSELIKGFDFVDTASRSVALSGILTAVSRAALPTAPMHGFDAPVAGSGKSKLVDIASIIATGHKAAVIADGGGVDEFEKRLAAALLGGDQIISLDNLEKPVGGQLLCQVLTQHAVVIRPFGKLENVVVPCLVMVFANGNNLTVIGDATRRSLVGRIDPKVERPELRKFEADPVRRAMEERPKLLVSALTVLRAWRVADDGGHSGMPDPLGSFEEWSRRVRNALIWLGEADPVEVIENMRGDDPRLAEVRQIMAAWQKALCSNMQVTVRDVIAAALRETTITTDGREISVRENPDLYAAVCAITRDRERDKSMGWWLRRYRDRVITLEGLRYRFVRIEDKWLLDAMDDVPF